MANGGWRPGAGAKKGSKSGKRTLKESSLVALAPTMQILAEKWLTSSDVKLQKFAFKELLPYVFRKQPMEVTGAGGNAIPISITREFLADVSARHFPKPTKENTGGESN